MIKRTTILLTALLISLGAIAQVKITQINLTDNEVSITNYGNSSVDITAYALCNIPAYALVDNLSIVSGNTNIPAGETVVLDWSSAQGNTGAIALYSQFGGWGSSASIVDFVQWGEGGNTRESDAVGASLWEAGDFLSGATTYYYIGDGSASGELQWSTTAPLATVAKTTIESSLYPNPVSNELHVNLSSSLENGVANVFDASGNLVMTHEVNGTSLDLTVSTLNEGMYILEVSDANGTSVSRFSKQ